MKKIYLILLSVLIAGFIVIACGTSDNSSNSNTAGNGSNAISSANSMSSNSSSMSSTSNFVLQVDYTYGTTPVGA